MLKRVFCIVASLTLFLIISFSPLCLSSHASYYEHVQPYSDLRFTADTSKYFYSDVDFFLIIAKNDGSYLNFRLVTLTDKNNYGFLKVKTNDLPSDTFILSSDYNIFFTSWQSPSTLQEGVVSFLPLYVPSISGYSDLVFDYYNSDKYPSCNGSQTEIILASNVDIYDYQGRLLQSGNYDTFMKYFRYSLDASKIKDYTSSSESATTTAPAVTTVPSGSSGDSDSDETTKGIFDTLKNIFSILKEMGLNIADLPKHTADAMGSFFDNLKISFSLCISDLKDNLLSGIEYLFKPSDNNFIEIQEIFYDKFKFVYQITGFFKDFDDAVYFDKPPDTNITIYGKTVSFVNWELYDRYKGFIDAIIISLSYYFYIRRLIKRLPGVIGGFHT